MAHPLDGARAKIERAKEHIRHVDIIRRRFLESGPYEVFPDHDPETGDHHWRVRFKNRIPIMIPLIAGDAIHNLRSSLDLLIWGVVSDRLTGRTPGRWAKWPIADSINDWKTKAETLRKIKAACPEAVDLINALEPYKPGNDGHGNMGLWSLHALDIEDKHHVLLTAATSHIVGLPSVGKEIPGLEDFPWPMTFINPADKIVEDGAVVFSDLASPKMNMDPEIRFDVAFAEREILYGEPVVPALLQFAQLVGGIVDKFGAVFS